MGDTGNLYPVASHQIQVTVIIDITQGDRGRDMGIGADIGTRYAGKRVIGSVVQVQFVSGGRNIRFNVASGEAALLVSQLAEVFVAARS